jgi:hypothetical protein
MASFEDLLKNDLTKSVAIGLGVVAAGVLLAPALKPVARATVKSGILLFEKGREWLAEAEESFEDLVAEVRAELAEDRLEAEGIGEAAAGEVAAEPVETHG